VQFTVKSLFSSAIFCFVPVRVCARMMTMMNSDVIIIGAGAAGLMCALEASGRGRQVVVLEHTGRIGAKIRMAGGGCCNFTNRRCSSENYMSENPRFCNSALKRFSNEDFLSLVEEFGLAWEQREHGRLFLKGPAHRLVDQLVSRCRERGAEFVLNCTVTSVKKADPFIIVSSRGEYRCESLVVATGGLSYPQSGASDLGHRLAKQFGLAVTPCQPALAELIYGPEDKRFLSKLTGIAVDAEVTRGGKRFAENILFTHNGLSGPAILQASLYWRPGESVEINWLPKVDIAERLDEHKRDHGGRRIVSVLSHYWPRRMAEEWSQRYFPSKPLAEYSRDELREAVRSIQHWIFQPAGTSGYRKAEVTRGGVDTRQLSSKTMEATAVKGLYFIGETLDVTGQLGGYNLQWAWSGGWAAGQSV
jgi:predicted Rossmann fold flavoprotein